MTSKELEPPAFCKEMLEQWEQRIDKQNPWYSEENLKEKAQKLADTIDEAVFQDIMKGTYK